MQRFINTIYVAIFVLAGICVIYPRFLYEVPRHSEKEAGVFYDSISCSYYIFDDKTSRIVFVKALPSYQDVVFDVENAMKKGDNETYTCTVFSSINTDIETGSYQDVNLKHLYRDAYNISGDYYIKLDSTDKDYKPAKIIYARTLVDSYKLRYGTTNKNKTPVSLD